jgi:hypothetical protein
MYPPGFSARKLALWAPALSGAVLRAADFHERTPGGVRRLEGPMLGAVVVVSLGPDIEVAGQRMGSFAAGLWDRPVVTGHFGEQAGYQLNLDLLSAGRLLGVPMSELANRLVRLEDLLGPIAAELVERMALAPDAASRHRLARGLIVRRLAEPSRFSPTVEWALSSPSVGQRGVLPAVGSRCRWPSVLAPSRPVTTSSLLLR